MVGSNIGAATLIEVSCPIPGLQSATGEPQDLKWQMRFHHIMSCPPAPPGRASPVCEGLQIGDAAAPGGVGCPVCQEWTDFEFEGPESACELPSGLNYGDEVSCSFARDGPWDEDNEPEDLGGWLRWLQGSGIMRHADVDAKGRLKVRLSSASGKSNDEVAG